MRRLDIEMAAIIAWLKKRGLVAYVCANRFQEWFRLQWRWRFKCELRSG